MKPEEIKKLAMRTLYLRGKTLNKNLDALISQYPVFVQSQMERFPGNEEYVFLALQTAYEIADGNYSLSFNVLRKVSQIGVEHGMAYVKRYINKAKREGMLIMEAK